MPIAMPVRSRRRHRKRGFRIVYELCLASDRLPTESGHYTWRVNHPRRPEIEATVTPADPPAASILASLGQADLRLGSRHRCHRLERQRRVGLSGYPRRALDSGAEFAKLIEPSRSIRADALGTQPARGGEGVPYRIEYGVRASTPRR